jgi:hypothetical protein
MSHQSLRFFVFVSALALGACSDDAGTSPTAQPDATHNDASTPDMPQGVDAGPEADGGTDTGTMGDADSGTMGDDMGTMGDDMGTMGNDAGPGELCTDGSCGPQDCIDNGWLPPSNLQRDLRPILNDRTTVVQTWEDFWGLAFPSGNSRDLEVERDRYVTMEFDTNGVGGSGMVVFDNPQGIVPSGSRLATISQCPGYFGPSPYPDDPDCRRWFFGIGNLRYAIGAATDTAFSCDLKPDRTYYLNIVFVNEVLPEGSEDLTWKCATGDMPDNGSDTCGALMELTYVP